jgi:hypothetical protein
VLFIKYYITVTTSRMVKSTRYVAHVEQMENAYKILVRKHPEKRPLERSTSTWEDNIGTDVREIRWEGVDWMHLDQDRD